MINFYNYFLLWFLPLSLLPLVFHLLSIKKKRYVKFSYTFIVEKIVNESLFSRRLKEIIVLLLRIIIIFLMIIYFARPVLYYRPKNEKVNLVVAVDTSFSAQRKIGSSTLGNFLIKNVENLLERLRNKNVKVHIVSYDEKVNLINKKFDRVEDISLDQKSFEWGYKSTNFSALLNYIFNLEIEDNLNIKVVVFTDFAEHSFTGIDSLINPAEKNKQKKIDFLFCYPEVDSFNNYVKSVLLSVEENLLNITLEPVVEKKDFSSLIQLFINNNLVDFQDFSKEKKSYTFTYLLNKEEKDISGYVSLPTDSLPQDNKFYFVQPISQKSSLCCIVQESELESGINSTKHYLEKLSILELDLSVSKYRKEYEKYNDFLRSFDNVMLVNVGEINKFDISNFGDKKFIVFMPEEDFSEYEKMFPELEIVGVEENLGDGFKIVGGEEKQFIDFLKEFNIENIKFNKRYRITVKDKRSLWKVLIKFEDGSPAVLSDGRIFLFSFALSKNWTNIVRKPFFISLLKKILLKKNNFELKNYYFVSEEIPLTEVKSVRTLYNGLEVSKQDMEITKSGVKIFVPGIFILQTEKEKRTVAVNIFSGESNLKVSKKEKVKKILQKVGVQGVSFIDLKDNKSIDEVVNWCLGKEYSDFVLFVLVVCFILETILSRFGRTIV